MGTSISQASPNASVWKAVAAGYKNKNISPERIATEIWRAGLSDSRVLEGDLKSEIVFTSLKIARESSTSKEAFQKISQVTSKLRNSIIGEIAMRAAISVAGRSEASSIWSQTFFSHVTDYFISRDASGYVGGGRIQSASELVEFKSQIKSEVAKKAKIPPSGLATRREWNLQVSKILSALCKSK